MIVLPTHARLNEVLQQGQRTVLDLYATPNRRLDTVERDFHLIDAVPPASGGTLFRHGPCPTWLLRLRGIDLAFGHLSSLLGMSLFGRLQQIMPGMQLHLPPHASPGCSRRYCFAFAPTKARSFTMPTPSSLRPNCRHRQWQVP